MTPPSQPGTHFRFAGDELILAAICVVRAVDPRILRAGPNGFELDFTPIEGREVRTQEERLLAKLRAALEAPGGENDDGHRDLALVPGEAHSLAALLETLLEGRDWAPDVRSLGRALRARLAGIE